MEDRLNEYLKRGFYYVSQGRVEYCDFCLAMIAEFGDEVRPNLPDIYHQAWLSSEIPATVRNRMDTDIQIRCIDHMNIHEEEVKEEDILARTKSDIDILFASVKEYRQSNYFMKLLDFTSTFKGMAPFNTMMAYIQRPGAMYLLPIKEWVQKYGRNVKPNARPILIMRPFGPWMATYELSDTYPIPGRESSATEKEIIRQLEKPFKADGVLDSSLYNNLLSNLNVYGIAYNGDMIAGDGFAAELRLLKDRNKFLKFILKDGRSFSYEAKFMISVNRKIDWTTGFAAVCHELGHFFCHHLTPPSDDWWKERDPCPRHSTMEFEAETVAWLVCRRLGIDTKSSYYLSHYLNKHGEVPQDISMESIYRAVQTITEMTEKPLRPSDGLLYSHDKEFKKKYNTLMEKKVEKKPVRDKRERTLF